MTLHIVDPAEVLLELGLSESVTDEQRAIVSQQIVKAEGDVRSFLRYDPLIGSRTEIHPPQAFQGQISRGIWEVMEQRAVLRQVSESATNELQLQHLPIRGTPAPQVWVDYDGRFDTRAGSFPTLKVLGTDYWPVYDTHDASGADVSLSGRFLTIGLWPTTAGTVKITYTSGYTQDELRGSDQRLNASPIWETCLEEAVRRSRRVLAMKKGRAGVLAGLISSEGLGDYNYSLESGSAQQTYKGDLLQESQTRLTPFINMGYDLGS